MPRNPADKVRTAVEELKSQLSQRSTQSVVGFYLGYCLQRANVLEFTGGFASPARQGDFLLSILASTAEPEKPKEYGKRDWENTIELLNRAFTAYQEIFWPDPSEARQLSDEWKRVRSVAMPAFIHYHNTSLLADPAQVRERIAKYLSPFDNRIETVQLISATDASRVGEWVGTLLERRLEEMNTVFDTVDEARKYVGEKRASVPKARELIRDKYGALGDSVKTALDNLGTVTKSELVSEFGDLGERYWAAFSIARGEGPAVMFPTESVIAASRPLIRLSPDRAMVPAINSLFTAVLHQGEQTLLASEDRTRYLSHRDYTLEDVTAQHFKRLLSPEAVVYRSVYETSDSRDEHDIVIVDGDVAFIVECKASPPTEPFRDPDKAFTRLRRAFHAETGIQRGFEQAARVRRRLDGGETVDLFDQRGRLVVSLDPQELRRRYCVVVTRDSFGPLATDLALLLEKQPEEPYPWVVNTLDLDSIADGWDFLQWSTEELCAYLDLRLLVNGKAFCSDELELVGFHLKHGSLEWLLKATADRVHVNQHYSDFFDELYHHRRYGAPAPKLEVRPPVMMDLRASLLKDRPVFVDPEGRPLPEAKAAAPSQTRAMREGPSRNTPCPCGSGRKFKRCCSRKSWSA